MLRIAARRECAAVRCACAGRICSRWERRCRPIVMLRNGSAMVLLGVRPGRAGQPDIVVLARPERGRGCAADARRGALQRRLGRRGRSDQARLPPARRGPSVRHGLDHRPVAARSADDPRSCDLRDSAQRSGARADRVLADHDRPGHALRQPQHLHDAVHRVRGAGAVRHRVRPSPSPDGAVLDDPGRRQDLEPYVRSAAQPADRLLRAHADRRDRARHVRDLQGARVLDQPAVRDRARLVCPDRVSADHVSDQHDHDRGRADPLPADVPDRGRPPADGPAQGRGGDAGRSGPRYDPRRGGARHADDQVAGAGRRSSGTNSTCGSRRWPSAGSTRDLRRTGSKP